MECAHFRRHSIGAVRRCITSSSKTTPASPHPLRSNQWLLPARKFSGCQRRPHLLLSWPTNEMLSLALSSFSFFPSWQSSPRWPCFCLADISILSWSWSWLEICRSCPAGVGWSYQLRPCRLTGHVCVGYMLCCSLLKITRYKIVNRGYRPKLPTTRSLVAEEKRLGEGGGLDFCFPAQLAVSLPHPEANECDRRGKSRIAARRPNPPSPSTHPSIASSVRFSPWPRCMSAARAGVGMDGSWIAHRDTRGRQAGKQAR